tara:strand:+ start:725 stop:1135 length:411 start_codon:yes stop_codon:yes gene_type:complete
MFKDLINKIKSKNVDTNIFSIFASNFIKGGLLLGVAITIIELIYKSDDLLGFYAFLSASFFIVQLFQFEYVNKKSPKSTKTFLINSIIGGILFVVYVFMMYYLHINNFSPKNVVTVLILIYIIFTLLYYLLIKSAN